MDVIFSSSAPSPEHLAALAEHGLGSVEGLQALRSLAVGTAEFAPSQRARRTLESLLPLLLREVPHVAFPVQAVQQFALLLRALRGFEWVYDLCFSHPPILRMLLRTLGYGPLLPRLLIAHPEWLDEVFHGGGLRESRTDESLRTTDLSFPALAPEAARRRLRQFKQLETFLIAVQEVLGITSAEDAAARTTALAEATLQGLFRRLAREDGQDPERLRLAVLGLGGLGDRQVHLHGDLDLAFVLDDEGLGDGEGEALTQADRLCRRLIAELSALTPDGQLWKVDARLRPDGKTGPLVATATRFREYYRREAGIWEWQALTKGRSVAGDVAFGTSVLEGLYALLEESGPPANLGQEILSMKQRIVENMRLPSTALTDLKRSPGGLVDAEFVVQFLHLRAAHDARMHLRMTTTQAVEEFVRRGDITGEQGTFLLEHLRFLRLVQRHHRLLFETTQDYLPRDPELQAALGRGLADQMVGTGFTLQTLPARMTRMEQFFADLLAAR